MFHFFNPLYSWLPNQTYHKNSNDLGKKFLWILTILDHFSMKNLVYKLNSYLSNRNLVKICEWKNHYLMPIFFLMVKCCIKFNLTKTNSTPLFSFKVVDFAEIATIWHHVWYKSFHKGWVCKLLCFDTWRPYNAWFQRSHIICCHYLVGSSLLFSSYLHNIVTFLPFQFCDDSIGCNH